MIVDVVMYVDGLTDGGFKWKEGKLQKVENVLLCKHDYMKTGVT
jgi:hypothetical protein